MQEERLVAQLPPPLPILAQISRFRRQEHTQRPVQTQALVLPHYAPPFAAPFGPGGTPFVTPLPSCLMSESFTSSGEFEDSIQQFKHNRPHYFALRLQGNSLQFYTTLSSAQQADFSLLVDAFRQNYTMNVDILNGKLKAAQQQPNQDFSAFLCDIRALKPRAYRALPHLVEPIVLASFIEGLNASTRRWDLRKSKPVTADDALAL